MSIVHIFLWAALILPWLTLMFLRGDVIRRYMPVAILGALLVTIVFEMAHAFRWWVLLKPIAPWGYITNVSFTYGLFLVGTIWIFFLTYKNVWAYFATNAAVDGFQAFAFHELIEGHVYRLERANTLHIFLLMFGLSIVIYVYQKWQEDGFEKTNHQYKPIEVGLRNPFGRKKAR